MKATLRYVARRVGTSVLMLLLTSIMLFVALRVIPGDPAEIRATQAGVTTEQLVEFRRELGLDRPIPVQYLTWIGGVFRGDFGNSYFSGFSTTELIERRLGPTIELTLAAVLLGLLGAVPAAVVSVVRPRSPVDRALSMLAAAGVAVPSFWLGIVLIALFSVHLGWFPTRGYVSLFDEPLENLRHLALPAVTLAVLLGSMFFRFLRASLLETIHAEFIRTAQGKGLLWRQVVFRHALPNGLLPTLTFVGLISGTILGGVVVIEFLFGWPGLGALAVDSVSKRDYPVLQAVGVIAAIAFLLTTLVVDLATLALDPRLRARRR